MVNADNITPTDQCALEKTRVSTYPQITNLAITPNIKDFIQILPTPKSRG